LTLLTTEKVRLPFKHKSIKPTNFQLLQFSNGVYIENLFEMAKLIPNPRNSVGVNYVEISGLSEGTYSIWLKKE